LAERRRRRTTLKVMIISPIIVTAFVLLGVFMGFYLSDLTGLSKGVLAVLLATGGLFVSLPIILKMTLRMVAGDAKERGAAKTAG
jgi:protein-S-isoprenylcysteine O-methyltransferase Ste14